MALISFSVCLLGFVVIGLLSVLRSKNSSQDYLVARQSIPAWLAALSAVATNNSGYMFIGMIGFTYAEGVSSVWLMIGWICGDFISSLFVHRNIRLQSQQSGALSFAGVLSNWQGSEQRALRRVLGVITLAFLGSYAAAQFNAGSKALHVLLGWDYSVGAIIGCVIVVAYCFAGGIRASIWTDAAQSFVMILAMLLLCLMGLAAVGGIGPFATAIQQVGSGYASWVPPDTGVPYFNPALFIMGWFAAGFGVIGQPHIMVRFMALDSPASMKRVRLYYYSWFTAFYGLTVIVGLLARLLIPDAQQFDAELALPTLAVQLLPQILVGVILAGIFAATMSTADSQVLSCSAALSRDLFPHQFRNFWVMKAGTIAIALLALLIALYADQSVFRLVLMSWSGLGAAFGPLLVVLALGQRVPQWLGILMAISGLVVVLGWQLAGLNAITYEILPGMLAGLLVFAAGRLGEALYRRSAS